MRRSAKRQQGASGRPTPGAVGGERGDGARWVLTLVLLAGAVGSALQAVMVSHQHREVHGMLEETRNYQDLLLAEHSRLLLERGALAAYHHVERVAQAELNMQFPDNVERLERVFHGEPR